MQTKTHSTAQDDSAKKVMVISTDGTAGAFVTRELTSAGGNWQVIGTTSHEEALMEISERPYSCVVLVFGPGQVTTLELVADLHQQSKCGACPVVLVSGSADSGLGARARQAGVTTLVPWSAINSSYIEHAVTTAVGQWRLMRVIDLLNQQVEEKQERRQTQQQRTERFAHEVLTPLASVQEYISLVFDEISGPINSEQASHLAYARGGCATIGASVEALVVAAGNHQLNTADADSLDDGFGEVQTIAGSLQTVR